MVTYSDMFQFCMLIVAVISLVVKVCNSKKKQPPHLPQDSGYFLAII